MFKKKLHSPEKGSGLAAAIVAIIIGLLFGLLLLLLTNPEKAFKGFNSLLAGAAKNGIPGLGAVLYFAATYILLGLSVGFAGKTGVFNIGGAGQFIIGATAAVYVGIKWTWLPSYLHCFVALLIGMIAGGIWGSLIGILKAKFNISEIVVGILLNYIGIYIINMFILSNIYDPLKNRTQPVHADAMVPRFGLDKIFSNTAADASIVIAIFMAIVVYIVLDKTVFGYEIKACGYNKNAGAYAGINAKRNIVLSMFISGSIAGLAGALFYLSAARNYIPVSDATPAQAMSGICTSLLAAGNPIGIIFSGLFIAYITVGGFNMQLYGYVPEIVDIVTSAIIYCSAFVILISKGIIIAKRHFRTNSIERSK